MIRVAIYARTSSDEQAQAGTIETQLDYARRYCDLNNLQIARIFTDDGISGTLPLADRPAGKVLLGEVKAKSFDMLLVYRIDRFGRNLRNVLNDQYALEQAGMPLKSMTEPFDTSTPMGRFVLQILAMFAQMDRDTLVERMTTGKQRVARAGRWPERRPPYGYRVEDKYLEVDPDEAAIVHLIYRLYTEDRLPITAIMLRLRDLAAPSPWLKRAYTFHQPSGVASERPATWHTATVNNILRNPVYQGQFQYRKRNLDTITINVPPIVPIDTWEHAQELLTRNRVESKRNRKNFYLLSGLIRCGSCGYQYASVLGGTHNGTRYYRCTSRITKGRAVTCRNPYARADTLEQIVWNDIREWVLASDDVVRYAMRRSATDAERDKHVEAEVVTLEADLHRAKTARLTILDLLRKGIVTEEEAVIDLEQHRGMVKDIETRLGPLYSQLKRDAVSQASQRRLAELRLTLKAVIDEAGDTERRDIVRSLVSSIVALEDGSFQIHYEFDDVGTGKA